MPQCAHDLSRCTRVLGEARGRPRRPSHPPSGRHARPKGLTSHSLSRDDSHRCSPCDRRIPGATDNRRTRTCVGGGPSATRPRNLARRELGGNTGAHFRVRRRAGTRQRTFSADMPACRYDVWPVRRAHWHRERRQAQGSPDRRRVRNSFDEKAKPHRRSGLPDAAPEQHADRTPESATIEIPLAASCKEIACQRGRDVGAWTSDSHGRAHTYMPPSARSCRRSQFQTAAGFRSFSRLTTT